MAPPLLLRCEQLVRPFAQLPLGREELSRERSFGLACARRLGAARRLRGLDRLEAPLQHHTVRLGLREFDPSVVLRGARAVDPVSSASAAAAAAAAFPPPLSAAR